MIKKATKELAGTIKELASALGVGLTSKQRLDQLQAMEAGTGDLFNLVLQYVGCKSSSNAQLYQDVVVLLVTAFKKNGFFVEFGATNGVDLSNTYLLEKEYGWDGILAEPAKIWHGDLVKNRNARIDFSCVWSKSHELLAFDMVDVAELSTLSTFSDRDQHSGARKNYKTYNVETISLRDLLSKHNAPRQIDYLSIDTEGSEFDILSNFDFREYEISIITCEHNYTENRDKIRDLLENSGFSRKFTGLSKWDDWYFNKNILLR